MKIYNFTPHAICIFKTDGSSLEIPSHGVARCAEIYNQDVDMANMLGFDFGDVCYGEVEGLPEAAFNADTADIYIVSSIVKSAIKAGAKFSDCKNNFVSPYGFVRNDAGQIIGCKGLAR